jgi:hypothetical protein
MEQFVSVYTDDVFVVRDGLGWPTRIGPGLAFLSPQKQKRKPLVFRERDIARAIAGHLKAGLSVARVEIDASGRIVVVTGNAESSGVALNNEWDDVR